MFLKLNSAKLRINSSSKSVGKACLPSSILNFPVLQLITAVQLLLIEPSKLFPRPTPEFFDFPTVTIFIIHCTHYLSSHWLTAYR